MICKNACVCVRVSCVLALCWFLSLFFWQSPSGNIMFLMHYQLIPARKSIRQIHTHTYRQRVRPLGLFFYPNCLWCPFYLNSLCFLLTFSIHKDFYFQQHIKQTNKKKLLKNLMIFTRVLTRRLSQFCTQYHRYLMIPSSASQYGQSIILGISNKRCSNYKRKLLVFWILHTYASVQKATEYLSSKPMCPVFSAVNDFGLTS